MSFDECVSAMFRFESVWREYTHNGKDGSVKWLGKDNEIRIAKTLDELEEQLKGLVLKYQ